MFLSIGFFFANFVALLSCFARERCSEQEKFLLANCALCSMLLMGKVEILSIRFYLGALVVVLPLCLVVLAMSSLFLSFHFSKAVFFNMQCQLWVFGSSVRWSWIRAQACLLEISYGFCTSPSS